MPISRRWRRWRVRAARNWKHNGPLYAAIRFDGGKKRDGRVKPGHDKSIDWYRKRAETDDVAFYRGAKSGLTLGRVRLLAPRIEPKAWRNCEDLYCGQSGPAAVDRWDAIDVL